MTAGHSPARVAAWFALAWSALAYVTLLVVPFYATASTHSGGHSTLARASFIEVNGPVVFATLAIPVAAAVLAVLPWSADLRRSLAIAGAVVATLFTILGAASVGLFFVPSSLALIASAALRCDNGNGSRAG